MAKISGGLLLYKLGDNESPLQVLVAHPGGPFFKNKDEGWWSIPKGEPDPGEDIFLAALREFEEETGEKSQAHTSTLGRLSKKMGRRYLPGLLRETGKMEKFLCAMK